ncbi:MAG: PEGA domain-containing protein [Patescibacteria group bacterium]
MKKKTRRIMFWSIVGLFVVAGAWLLVYSFGYRVDWQTLQISQTGGLYIKTSPKITDVFLDGENTNKKSGLLSTGIFVQNLFPRSYQLKIAKEGYFDWSKKVQIEPSLVNNFSHIILLPQSPLKENVYEATSTVEITDFFPLGNKEEILLETKIKNKSGWFGALSLFNNKNATTTEIFRKKITSTENPDLLSGFVLDDSNPNQIIFSDYSRSSGQTIFYLWDRLDPDQTVNLSQAASAYNLTKIRKIVFYPFEDGKYIIETSKNIAVLDLNRKEKSFLAAENPLDFTISGGNLFWLDKEGGVYSYNFILKNTSPLAIIESEKIEITNWAVSVNSSSIAVLMKNNELLLIRSGQPVKIISPVAQNFSFSPDNKKLAYQEVNGQVKIYFLEDFNQDINKKLGEEVTLDGLTVDVSSQMLWFKDSYHLIVQNGEKIMFAEIDDRDKFNIFQYQFGLGRYILNGEGVIFRSWGSLLEKINLIISE